MPAELAKRVICACIREIYFFRDVMGLKRQKIFWSVLARHLYTRHLACEPQTGSVAYLSGTMRNGTKKRPVLLIEMFNRHQFFSTSTQNIKINLMQNETNLWSIFW